MLDFSNATAFIFRSNVSLGNTKLHLNLVEDLWFRFLAFACWRKWLIIISILEAKRLGWNWLWELTLVGFTLKNWFKPAKCCLVVDTRKNAFSKTLDKAVKWVILCQKKRKKEKLGPTKRYTRKGYRKDVLQEINNDSDKFSSKET